MAANSKIEWTDSSWTPIRALNPVNGNIGWHCEHATTGCERCYAEGMNKRLGTGLPFRPGHRKDIVVYLDEEMLQAPLRWKKPRMVFVCSMTDAFASFVTDEWLDKMFAVMALCPQHTFQVLTKRAERMREYVNRARCRNDVELAAERFGPSVGFPASPKWCFEWPLPNVWLGVSCERQQEAVTRIPLLLQTPAAVRFLSCEPLLGPIDLCLMFPGWQVRPGVVNKLAWVITGGESGPDARPMNPQWARDIRDQCAMADVAFFHKQNGEFASVSEVAGPGRHHTFEDHRTVRRVGKKAAGRLLDGKEWNQFPTSKQQPQPASAPVLMGIISSPGPG